MLSQKRSTMVFLAGAGFGGLVAVGTRFRDGFFAADVFGFDDFALGASVGIADWRAWMAARMASMSGSGSGGYGGSSRKKNRLASVISPE